MIPRGLPSFLWLLVILISSLQTHQDALRAAEPKKAVCDPADPEKCSVGLIAGQEAPFTGQLLTAKLAISIGQKATYCQAKIDLEVDRVARELTIKLELSRKKHQIDQQAATDEIKLLEQRLEVAYNVPFYRRPLFIVLTTAVAVTASIFGVGKLLSYLPAR